MCLTTGVVLEIPRTTEETGCKFFYRLPDGGIISYYKSNKKLIPLGIWMKAEDFQPEKLSGIKFNAQQGHYPPGFHFYKDLSPLKVGRSATATYYHIRARNILVDGFEHSHPVGVAQEILVEEEILYAEDI